MAKGEVSHKGRITDINPDFTTVEIISESACASCHASSLCGMGESTKKEVTVRTTIGDWAPGDEVEVVLKRTMGLKAVWVAYVVPLLLMMAVLLALTSVGVGELASGLAAIAAVGVYYLGVYILRDRLKNDYTFYIKKND